MAGVDAHLSENVERLQLQKRQNLETSTSLLTPDIYCALFFRDKVKSPNVTHTRWCITNGDKKKKMQFPVYKVEEKWSFLNLPVSQDFHLKKKKKPNKAQPHRNG